MSCKQWDAFCDTQPSPYDPGFRYTQYTLNGRIERLLHDVLNRVAPNDSYSWTTPDLLVAAS